MKKLLIIAFITFTIISCTNQKQLVYLNNLNSEADSAFFPKTQPEYRIQKQDILYVKIYTLNSEISNVINQTNVNQSNLFQNETSLFINGYIVNDSGKVEIPVIGKVEVFDKTIDEATESVRVETLKYLKDAAITLKLISFKFSVLGEVKNPGTYRNYNNQLTVLEAISMAGDITDYGLRSKILVLRPSKKGTQTFRLDLTDKKILTSDGYFLLPNDIVYVEPMKSKSFKLNIPAMTLVLSTITTLVLIMNLIYSTNQR